ncbi:sensor histidine kinase [Limosilactobacillus caecicola]|uniref:hypothetical protein n=1 Tax=Limosilactobacillus caecicola TaxID=2941332 RepID=UPI002040210C|nr:hypothetical protein [Limosilactobacillus caecicola]
MTFFNINNPFIQAPSQSYLWNYIIKVSIFYTILFWGTYRHVAKTRLRWPFYLTLAVIFVFFQPNLFLNDLIVTFGAIAAVYYFSNPNEEHLSSIVAKFGATMLIYYYASYLGLIGARWLVGAMPQTSALVYFVLVPIIYLLALIIIRLSQPILQRYFAVILAGQRTISYLLFLLFLPLSYLFYVFQYNPHLLSGVLHVSDLNLAVLVVATGYYLLSLLILYIYAKIVTLQNQLNATNFRLENLESYTSELEVLYDDMRRFKHDYKNILYSLKSALNTNQIEYAQQSLDQLTSSTDSLINLPTQMIGQLQNIQNSGIKAVVYGKINQALKHDLNVKLEIVAPIDLTKSLDQIDAIRVLAILLDNAIHAAS